MPDHRTSRSPPSRRGAGCWPIRPRLCSDDEIEEFRAREAFWIDDWARVAGGRRAVADQVRFEREWRALRAYAGERGVGLIGDVPIYVAPGSADHVAWPELFRGGEVAGAPPDVYSDKGQLWGNPLYDWPALQRRRYRWWTERLRRTFALFDVTRIDHFRGFVAYWAVPEGAPDASGGHWRRGPGRAVFDAAAAQLGELPMIAEDLGVITEPVARLRRSLGFPGMVVLQFGFDPDDPRGPHRLEHHERDSVVYTGTHDQDTLAGWWSSLDEPSRSRCSRPDRGGRLRGGRGVVVVDPARVLVAGADGDAPGAGRARPRQRGADEHPGARDGLVALADGAWRLDGRAREAVAGRDGGGGTAAAAVTRFRFPGVRRAYARDIRGQATNLLPHRCSSPTRRSHPRPGHPTA